MNKIILICASTLALIGAQTAANAATYRPAGNTTFSGAVVATVGTTTMNCNISVTLNVPEANPDGHVGPWTPALATDNSHGHSATVTAFSLSGGPLGACAAASLVGLPYTVTASGSTLTIVGVNAKTFVGTKCLGNFTGTWNGTALVVPSQTLNDPGSTMSCTFQGSLTPNHPFNVQ